MNNKKTDIKDRKGQTITFYSYKGGVGRSMALVNIACLAAKENKKILLMDCDLEAPGLHQFFKIGEDTPGFVDLISDINEWIAVEENNNEEGYSEFMDQNLKKYIAENINPIAPNTGNASLNSQANPNHNNAVFDTTISVDLIKAGKFDSGYSKKLNAIDWLDMYKNAPAFFRTFAFYLEKEYDYIFIDARTGLADTSGICTMLMPQKLVLVFALNNQNINGVVDVAKQAIDYRFKSNDYRELQVYPLPSRIENSANPYLQQWIDNYKEKFIKLFTEKYTLDECKLSAYFDRCFIQYYAIHAYGENIPALYESSASSNFITYNYNNFWIVLKKNLPAWEIISLEEELANQKLANEYIKKALDLYYKNEFTKAVEENSKAIELVPDYSDGYINRGIAKQAMGLYSEALQDFDKAIELEPENGDGYYNRGSSKYIQKLYDSAIEDFDKAIECSPNDSDAYVYRGITKDILKLHDDAINDYNKAVELNPDDAKIYYNRGLAKSDLQLNNNAMQDFNKAIELKPDEANPYNGRGNIWSRLKEYEKAMADYNKAIELNPNDANYHFNRGNVKALQGLYDSAVVDFDKAIELNPTDAEFYNNRGASRQHLNLYEDSLKDFGKALEIMPGYELAATNKKSIEKLLNKI